MWEENGDGQRINRDNTYMNVKLKEPDRETTTIEERSGDEALLQSFSSLVLMRLP